MSKYLLSLALAFPLLAFAVEPGTHPQIKWKFQSGAPIRGSVAIDGNKLYFGNSEGRLFCINKETASVEWEFRTGGAINSQPVLADGKLIVQSRDNTVYAVDAADGSLQWKFLMPRHSPHTWGWDYYDASPVIYGKNVLIGSGDHKVYSLSLNDGKQQWAYVAGDKIRGTPALVNDTLYVPAFDGFLHVLDARTGQVLNKFGTEGIEYYGKIYGWDRSSLIGKPAVKDQQMVIGSRDGGLYKLNLNTMEKEWRFSYGSSWVGSSAAVDSNTVFVGWSDAHVFSAHDLATGRELWKFNGHAYFYASPVTDSENVYTGSFNGYIYAFDKQNGEVAWSYQTGGAVLSSPVLEDGILYTGSDNGCLYAFEPAKKVYRAVYSVEGGAENEMVASRELLPYFEKLGYLKLDSTSLSTFMDQRIADGQKSVIVFAHQYLPGSVTGNNASEGLLRRYMEAGGKVVWLGYFPNYWVADKTMKIVNMNPKYAEELLGISFDVNMDFGTYFASASETGRQWGLPQKFEALGSSFGSSDGLVPLAYNEFGRIAAFYKPFGKVPLAGFVHFRSWSLMPARERDFEAIRSIAEFGY